MGSLTRRRQGLILVGGLALVSVCWFLVFHAWWLNSDGTTYLGTGRGVLHGHGFRLPDGTAPSWWNRPLYPVFVALPSSLGGGIRASIWMSRVPLMLAAPIVAAATLRLGRSVPAAALAGLVAIAQPWTLLAGGSNLVPDGLMSLFMLGSVLSASIGVDSTTRRSRAGWFAAALVCVVLASLTKQTGAAMVLPVALVVWNGLARPPRWMVVLALVLEVVAVFGVLVVANGAPEVSTNGLPRVFVHDLRTQVFTGSPAIVVAGVISLALVAWALPRATQPLPLAGLTLTTAAVAIGVYASGDGLQLRNAAILPYGVALLLGALVVEHTPAGLWSRWSRVVLGAALVISLGVGADARAYSVGDVRDRNWDSAANRGVADFLLAHRSEGTTGCTLDYCSFFWLAAGERLSMELLPQYSARPTAQSVADLDFSQRAGFRGPTPASPPCTGTPLVVTKSDEGFGAVFECALLRYIRSEHPAYLVVSGSGGSDTFDAARLIPYLSSNPAFRLVYSTPMSAWPHVTAAYQVVGVPHPVADSPSYYSQEAYDALPDDHGLPGVQVLDGVCYAETIGLDLSSSHHAPPSSCQTSR